MTNLVTERSLLDALTRAARGKLSPEELRQQRIDYIIGCLSDEGTTVTRAQVVNELEKFSGEAA
ncbi:MAG: hypothetical protein FJX28_02075 [Alphaproteobacteria bacterium]|jgi:hypothetical protein|nr:hypothetical protein [Alphaproteobacteria bacterium]